MKGLTAILVMVLAIVLAVVVLAVMTFRPAAAASRPQGRMQLCTAQWLDRHETDRSGYKPFLRQCLSGAVVEPVAFKVAAGKADVKKPGAKKTGRKSLTA